METTSSADDAVAQRKSDRFSKGSSLCPIIHTSLHLHITIFPSHDGSSHRTMHHEWGTSSWSVLHSLRLKTDDSHETDQHSPAHALLTNLGPRRVRWNSCWRGANTQQDPPRTTETGRQQSNPSPVSDRSTKRWTAKIGCGQTGFGPKHPNTFQGFRKPPRFTPREGQENAKWCFLHWTALFFRTSLDRSPLDVNVSFFCSRPTVALADYDC